MPQSAICIRCQTPPDQRLNCACVKIMAFGYIYNMPNCKHTCCTGSEANTSHGMRNLEMSWLNL